MSEVKDISIVGSESSSLVIPNRKNLEDRLAISKNFLQLNVNEFSKDYSPAIQQGINEIVDIVNNNTTVPELYHEILQEVSVGQSIFQSQAVQMEQHFTPHRKLRQIMLELEGKLGALDTSKNGCKKAVIKLSTLKDELEQLQEIFNKVNDSEYLSGTLLLEVSTFVPNIISQTMIDSAFKASSLFGNNDGIKSDLIKNRILSRLKSILGDKLVKFDETERGLKSHRHMIKDAALATHHLRSLVDKYKQEADATNWSFDESELYYYVMYFTSEGEKQYRTGGRIDTGTFGVVSSMPTGLRNKIFSNWDFIITKHNEQLRQHGKDNYKGYYWQDFKEIVEPKWDINTRTFEGESVQEFACVDVPNLIKKSQE